MARALYVITRAQRRGAEVDATLLAEALAPDYEPLVVTVYPGDPAVLGSRVPVLAPPNRRLSIIRRTIKEAQPDLLVAYGGEPLLKTYREARRAKVPLLYVKISMAVDAARRGLRRAVLRRAMRRCAAVAAVAPHLVRELREAYGLEGTIHLTPTFRRTTDIPPARHRAAVREELGIGAEDLLAAFVGSLSEEKGPDVALEAVAKSRRRVHLLVAGDGPMSDWMARRITDRDLAGRVHLLGPRGDVPRLLAGADAVLVTSRQEGRPGVILEAALGGLPVVAMAVGGVPDLVTHRAEGLLVPPGDAEAAATALNELLADPALRRSLGEAARARSGDYLPEAVLPAWRAAFRDALGDNPSE
jgi:glycosyltransferase involved in cell wall biosynthesis